MQFFFHVVSLYFLPYIVVENEYSPGRMILWLNLFELGDAVKIRKVDFIIQFPRFSILPVFDFVQEKNRENHRKRVFFRVTID